MLTLALITLIVFLSVWGYQVLDRKAKEAEYKKKTTTNIPLQREIRKKWSDILAKDIDVVRPDVDNVYEYVYSLYEKYGVPAYTWMSNDPEKIKKWHATMADNTAFEEGFKEFRRPDTPPYEGYVKESKKRTIRERIFGLPDADRYSGDGSNQTVESFYWELVSELTHRDMWEAGYACSWDGVHGSEREELEKQIARTKEEKKKYPWLYE